MADNKFRVRTMGLLLYPDNPEHVQAKEKIEKSFDYIGILHDKDKNEDGTMKKPHWHIILRFKDGRWNTAVAKELGITDLRFIEDIKKFENAMLYLIHYNNAEKAQYEFNEVFGTMTNRLKELLNNQDKSEGEKVKELINYIKEHDGYITVTDFAEYCAINGYWAEFRRSGAIFCKILEEKNNIVYAKKCEEES